MAVKNPFGSLTLSGNCYSLKPNQNPEDRKAPLPFALALGSARQSSPGSPRRAPLPGGSDGKEGVSHLGGSDSVSLWTVAAGLLCQWDSPGLVGSLSLRPRGWLGGTESACTAGDPRSIPGSGRSPGEGNGNPLQDTLACRIGWTEETGGLQSMGSQSQTSLNE